MRMPRRTSPFSQEERDERLLWMREAYDASLKPNSRKNMRSAVKGYNDFCALMGYNAFPLTLQSVALYLADYVARGHAPTSIAGILCHLRRHCTEEYLPWLSSADEARLRYLRRGLCRLAPRRGPCRAEACMLAVLQVLFETVSALHPDPEDKPTSREITVLTMCMLAHNALLRSGELLELKVGDISWDSRTSCRVRIVTSKANPFGLPEVVPLMDYAKFSAPICLRHYWDLFKVDTWGPEAPLFTRGPSILGASALSKDLFIQGFRRLLCFAGLPSADFSGHSFRAGGATDSLSLSLVPWQVPPVYAAVTGSMEVGHVLDLCP